MSCVLDANGTLFGSEKVWTGDFWSMIAFLKVTINNLICFLFLFIIFLWKQGSSENDGRSHVYDSLELRLFLIAVTPSAVTLTEPILTILKHFWPFWIIFHNFWLIRTILDHLGPYWSILNHFDNFWPFWTLFDNMDNFN